MKNNVFGQQILTEDDVCEFYLSNPDKNIKSFITEDTIAFPTSLEFSDLPNIINYIQENLEQQTWDSIQQQKWFMPDEYKTFDIALYVLSKCKTEEELQRAGEELFLFQERGLFPLLQYLKYLVDTMRANNIVWGVGRGSSVASYVLFIIGVHKIDSVKYKLPINEFFKGE